MLFRSNVATFYPPDTDGNYKVVMEYYDSQTTNIFMYENGLHYYGFETTEGKQVRVPYVRSWNPETKQHEPSATLWFNKDHKLILNKSSHKDIYTYKSSAEDKANRKQFRQKLETLMTLALFRLPEFRANVTITSDLGAPFGTSWRNSPRELEHFEETARQVGADNTENPKYIESFLNMGQAVFNIRSEEHTSELQSH